MSDVCADAAHACFCRLMFWRIDMKLPDERTAESESKPNNNHQLSNSQQGLAVNVFWRLDLLFSGCFHGCLLPPAFLAYGYVVVSWTHHHQIASKPTWQSRTQQQAYATNKIGEDIPRQTTSNSSSRICLLLLRTTPAAFLLMQPWLAYAACPSGLLIQWENRCTTKQLKSKPKLIYNLLTHKNSPPSGILELSFCSTTGVTGGFAWPVPIDLGRTSMHT